MLTGQLVQAGLGDSPYRGVRLWVGVAPGSAMAFCLNSAKRY